MANMMKNLLLITITGLSLYIHNNNWFELVYSLTDSSGKEIAYDGDVWESLLDKTTPEQLKADMLDAGINFMEYHIGRESDLFYRSYYEPEI